MMSGDDAAACIEALNGTNQDGKTMTVAYVCLAFDTVLRLFTDSWATGSTRPSQDPYARPVPRC